MEQLPHAAPQKQAAILILWIGCALRVLAPSAHAAPSAASPDVFFEKKVRPLLEEHCIECHSASKKIKGGLRLDLAASWKSGGDSGPAIIAGNPETSLLMKAVRYKDPDFQMPPRKKLAAADIEILENWIQSGAHDPRLLDPATTDSSAPAKSKALPLEQASSFWAYRPPSFHPTPSVLNSNWPEGIIDRFLLAKMEAANVAPAKDSQANALLRRLHLLLTGLPPEEESLERFVPSYQRNPSAAVAEETDRLLGSPAFAEAFARRWLDLVRFAESSGGGRTLLFKDAWRYRDYVLNSIRDDIPWNRFITEQIAGDLLPADSEAEKARLLTATGFLTLGPTNYEEQDKQQLRFDIIDEQLDTIGKAFLGQTISCARCHDHKFDPIPQRDYYALAGILSSTQTLLNLTDNVARWIAHPLPGNPEEESLSQQHAKQVADLKTQIQNAKTKVARLNSAPRDPSALGGSQIDPKKLPGIVLDETDAKLIGNWKRSTFTKKHVGDAYLSDENSGKGEKTVTFTPKIPETGRFEVRFAYTALENRSKEVRVTVFHADGEEAVYIDQTEEPSVDGYFTSLGTFRFEKDGAGYILVSNSGTSGYVVVDAVQLIPDALPVTTSKTSTNTTTDSNASSLTKEKSALPEDASKAALKQARDELASLNKNLKELEKKAPHRSVAMVVKDGVEIADTEIRVRGIARQKGAPVPRGFLRAALLKDSETPAIPKKQSGRKELAEWLTSNSNPLTAKVLVNRVWAWLFGKGIVPTTENFGTTGEPPSHPELLDDLARRFMNEGWSLRKLVREIVTSHAWRLEALSPPESDPANSLLSCYPVRRLDADQIRDAMLQAGGRLHRSFGGPDIEGAMDIDANDSGAAKIEYNYAFKDVRRSVYTPAFRNRRHELFEAFDFGDINNSIGTRDSSTVAPQALFFLNSAFAGEQAKATGARFAQMKIDPEQTIQRMTREILARNPTPDELSTLLSIFAHGSADEPHEDGLARVAHALFACVDFRYLR